jgi:2-dehydropantoate 2-reductase
MLGTWREGLAALQRDGVQVQGADGSYTAYPVQAYSDPAASGECSLALVLVKAWQTEAAARRLAACLAPDGLAISLQNGLGNHEVLAAVLGEARATAGVTTTGASMAAPGIVRPAGEGVVTLETRFDLDAAAGMLSGAGFAVVRTADLASLQWGKLVINAAINPLTAILNLPNGDLLKSPAARSLMAELALETAGVAYASNVKLPYPDPVAMVEKVALATANNVSSMLQDVRRGALTEVDAINGAVASRAASQGLSAPFNWGMWQLVQALH